jgi:hypothetical protein
VAIERVPLWRRAGAGLALPVFNKLCVAHLIFFRAKRGAIFALAGCFAVCVGRLSAGAIRSGLPVSFEASGFGLLVLWGNYATLSGSVSFGFLVLLFSFFVSHLLHYSCVKVCIFFGGEAAPLGFLDLGRGELRNKGQGRGQGARVSGAFGGACFWGGFLYSSLMGRATHPPIGGRCAIIAQIEGHHVSIKERQSNKQQERHPFRH